jgi:hypothetical protein
MVDFSRRRVMRHGFAGALILGAFLLSASARPAAHHAVQAAFDQDDHATLTGVLTKVLWINPHVRWFLDVKDETGKVTTWTISGAGPGGFRDIGISGRDVFKTGETYTAIVAKARDGSPNGYILTFVLADGRKIDLWHQYKSEAGATATSEK